MAGSAIASALNIVDGLVVIGGGLAGASHYILPALVNELRATLSMFSGEQFPCLQMEVYNWEDEMDRKKFLDYQHTKRIAVMCSREGASCSIMRGAYAYALSQLEV